jgi:CheY-like chemotaxis protein
MDIRLGRKDSGLHVARQIRKSSAVPIVFCTAYADSAPVEAEVRSIENAYLVDKPVDEEQLEWLLRASKRAARPRHRRLPRRPAYAADCVERPLTGQMARYDVCCDDGDKSSRRKEKGRDAALRDRLLADHEGGVPMLALSSRSRGP